MRAYVSAALFSVLASGAWAADPVEGVWKSPQGDSGATIEVTIAACGGAFCGTISKVTDGDASLEGKRMLWDMAPDGAGAYAGGRVWAPDDDKTYRGKLELAGNALKISGCVLGGAVCRGETFSRLR